MDVFQVCCSGATKPLPVIPLPRRGSRARTIKRVTLSYAAGRNQYLGGIIPAGVRVGKWGREIQ